MAAGRRHHQRDEVLAVADGTSSRPSTAYPIRCPAPTPQNIPLAEADGNFVVLDIGDGFFVNYAHMEPNSVRVEPGDRVRMGDVLGLVGNTGNSVAPHLHLHVMDRAARTAAAEARPAGAAADLAHR
jgi:murein DD-endopeptidase MepM/ murein hydrolase activator NlpD